MAKPYIGVTGFMSKEEVEQVLESVPTFTERKLMIGVLVSSKTMQGLPNKFPNRYPAAGKIAEIFPAHRSVLNLVHFNTKEPDQLLDQMFMVTELGGENFHGFQLNIKWPNPHTLEQYKKQCPGKTLVLQCGETALGSVECDPEKLVASAKNYQDICEYLLIDPSGGLGRAFNPEKGLEYLRGLKAGIKNMSFGIAGGLSPLMLEDLLLPVLAEFPDVSIDAEGRLRGENDQLNVWKAKRFVSASYVLFKRFDPKYEE